MARRLRVPAVLALVLLLAGCADFGFSRAAYERRFSIEQDAFAFPNELVWSYHVDERGVWRVESRVHSGTYIHRCFVLARTARQFFQHARFDPSRPAPDDDERRSDAEGGRVPGQLRRAALEHEGDEAPGTQDDHRAMEPANATTPRGACRGRA